MDQNIHSEAAKVGKMFVTHVSFDYKAGGSEYNYDTKQHVTKPSRWLIQAKLSKHADSNYHNDGETYNFEVDHSIGQEIAKLLIPVVMADAARKAQQLADDSKAMLEVLGQRAVDCITDIQKVSAEQPPTKE